MKDNNAETMIFFSLHYPYHFTDSYLDEEINLLAAKFKKVIVITGNTFSDERRPVPENVVVYRFSPQPGLGLKLGALQLLFGPLFYQRLALVTFKYNALSMPVVKELLAFYARALATKHFIEKIIEEQQIDKKHLLIYTYWMIESTMAAVLLKQQNPAIKVISKAHSQDVYFERSPVGYHPYRTYIFKHLSHLFFISENARDYFVETHKVSPAAQHKISVSRIGIPGPESYIPKTEDGVLRIISVAYIQKIKRVDLIVDALALMPDIKIEWYHAGHSNHSEADFEKIKEYAAAKFAGHANIMHHFLGKTGKEDLFKLYKEKKFDVFLNTSETEGIPVSMMEAISYSVPVIGTNVGGVAEIIADGVNGYLLSPYPDAEEVKEAILRFYNLSVDARNEMRRQAYSIYSQKYNSDVNYHQVADKIDEILSLAN